MRELIRCGEGVANNMSLVGQIHGSQQPCVLKYTRMVSAFSDYVIDMFTAVIEIFHPVLTPDLSNGSKKIVLIKTHFSGRRFYDVQNCAIPFGRRL